MTATKSDADGAIHDSNPAAGGARTRPSASPSQSAYDSGVIAERCRVMDEIRRRVDLAIRMRDRAPHNSPRRKRHQGSAEALVSLEMWIRGQAEDQ